MGGTRLRASSNLSTLVPSHVTTVPESNTSYYLDLLKMLVPNCCYCNCDGVLGVKASPSFGVRVEINRKGRNFGFCRKFEVKILQKDFCFLFHFGRKEIFCRKSQFLPKSCHFGRNKPPVWCPKYCYFCRKEPLSAEI